MSSFAVEPVADAGGKGGGSGGTSPYRQVQYPQRRNFIHKVGERLQETFLADDPFGRHRDEPPRRRAFLSVQQFFPVLGWAQHYTLAKFASDIVAGLTIASLAIPQDIGYAKLAGLDPKYALYTSFVTPLVYAVLGSSLDLAIGPVAVVSLLLGELLRNEVDPKKHPVEYVRLAFTANFFTGVIQAGLGFLRLGFIIDFLSHAAVIGFMAGAAVTIALQQLKGLLGIKNFTNNTDIISVLQSVFDGAPHTWNNPTLAIGFSFLVFLLVTRYIGKRWKKLFWVAALSPMFSVIIATMCVYLTRADNKGVNIVGDIGKGLNPSSVSQIFYSGDYALAGFRVGIVAAFIALAEAIAIGRTFAALKGYQISGNSEMIALGSMNIIGSLTSCYTATGSFSRSAVNNAAGCQTPVSNVVMALVVMLFLLVITPLFKFTPNAVIAAIIIQAVIGLIDFKAAYKLWKVDKMDFLACLAAFIGVLFKSVEIGILVAVAASVIKIILEVMRPRIVVLGKLSDSATIYRNINQYKDASTVPGILILRIDSAVYFPNANYIRERILRWLHDEDQKASRVGLPTIRKLILELSPVIDIDTTGIHALEDLFKILQKREVQLLLANPGPEVLGKLEAAEFVELIGAGNVFVTVGDAVAAATVA